MTVPSPRPCLVKRLAHATATRSAFMPDSDVPKHRHSEVFCSVSSRRSNKSERSDSLNCTTGLLGSNLIGAL